VQEETVPCLVKVLKYVVDPLRVETGSTPLETVDFVSFGEKKLRQVGAILAGAACDQRFFHMYGRILRSCNNIGPKTIMNIALTPNAMQAN
jgi:hypothetical protein